MSNTEIFKNRLKSIIGDDISNTCSEDSDDYFMMFEGTGGFSEDDMSKLLKGFSVEEGEKLIEEMDDSGWIEDIVLEFFDDEEE